MSTELMEQCSQGCSQDAATSTTKTILGLKEIITSGASTCFTKSMMDTSKHTQLPSTTSSNASGSSLTKQVGGMHYKDMAIQPVEYAYRNNIPFLEGNIIKYVSRWKSKNGIADLEKAKHCIELLIDLERQHGHK